MNDRLPQVGWIIVYTTHHQTKEKIDRELLSWLKDTGWCHQVKIVFDGFMEGSREEIDLIAHIYQSNPSLNISIGTSEELDRAIPTIKRRITHLL